jgi:hypothetical protein
MSSFDATYLLRVERKILLTRPKGHTDCNFQLPAQSNITDEERDEMLEQFRQVYAMTFTPATETTRPHFVYFAERSEPLPDDHPLTIRGARFSVPAFKALLCNTDEMPVYEGFGKVPVEQNAFNANDLPLLEHVITKLKEFDNMKTLADWIYDGDGLIVRKKKKKRSEQA